MEGRRKLRRAANKPPVTEAIKINHANKTVSNDVEIRVGHSSAKNR